MASEIPSARPSPSIPNVQRVATSAVNSILQLQGSLPSQLNIGDSAQAQVLALRETQQAFQVLLRLSLSDGQQRTVEVQSSQPLVAGNVLKVTALSAQQLAFSLVPASTGAIATRIDTTVLTPGTLLEGKVTQVEPNPQGGFKVVVSVTNNALAGQQLQIDSPKSLPLNSVFTARIDGAQQLTFQPLNTRLEPLAINQELQKQFGQQGSLNQLFKGLDTVSPQSISPEAQKAITQLLGGLPEITTLMDPKKLAQSLINSGAQLENKLLSGAFEHANQDMKANLLRLIAQLVPMLPSSNPTLAASQSALLSQALPGLLRDQLLGNTQTQLREQAMRFPLPARLLQSLDNPNDLGSLLKLAAAAVSRLQTHQLSSLGQTHTTHDGTQVTVWQLEVPARDQQHIVPLQIKFQHEEPTHKKSDEPVVPLWKIDLSFDLEPLGPLHIQASLQGTSISSQLWAQQGATAELIEHELSHLRDRLLGIGLTVKDLSCHQGSPPQGEKTTLQQRWIDDLA